VDERNDPEAAHDDKAVSVDKDHRILRRREREVREGEFQHVTQRKRRRISPDKQNSPPCLGGTIGGGPEGGLNPELLLLLLLAPEC